MQTLNQYPRNVQIRAIGKLIKKYGHIGTIATGAATNDCLVLFGKYKLSLSGGTLIINNNYKLHVLPTEALGETPIPVGTTVTVNGADMVAINVRKISPDGANAIVWEIEVAGGSIPDDVPVIDMPTVESPANNTSNYASVSGTVDDFAIEATASIMGMTTGVDTYVSSDWQIATDDAFSTVVDSVTGYTGGLTWTSNGVLTNPLNYYIRVKHNGAAVSSAWSAGNLFSLGTITVPEVTHIVKPTIITTLYSGVMSTFDTADNGSGMYKAYLEMSAYDPVDAGAYASSYWQIASDAGFTTLVYDQTGVDGYDVETGMFVGPGVLGYATGQFPLAAGTTYYARAKYVSVDPYESVYSDAFEFIAHA